MPRCCTKCVGSAGRVERSLRLFVWMQVAIAALALANSMLLGWENLVLRGVSGAVGDPLAALLAKAMPPTTGNEQAS